MKLSRASGPHWSTLSPVRTSPLPDAMVREDAILLEIPRASFDALYHGTSPASTRLHRVIQRSLLASLAQTNRHLTRLISLARLRGADREGEALEKALVDYLHSTRKLSLLENRALDLVSNPGEAEAGSVEQGFELASGALAATHEATQQFSERRPTCGLSR